MIEFKDITPEQHRCSMSMACPKVERSEDGKTYRIKGKYVPINPGFDFTEVTIEISAEILEGALGCQAKSSDEAVSSSPSALQSGAELAAGGIPRLDDDLCDPMDKLTWQIVHALEAAVTPAQWLQARELLSQFEPRADLAADRINAASSRSMAEMLAEIARLRAVLARSKDPCVYCSLPAERWTECRSGFPGCARADDMMGCPEFGASMDAQDLRAEIAKLTEALDQLLDDMGEDGLCVCPAAKKQAIAALERRARG